MWKCTYIETSAKNNVNIEAVFQEILTLEQKRQLSFQVEEIKVSCLEGSFKFNEEHLNISAHAGAIYKGWDSWPTKENIPEDKKQDERESYKMGDI